MLGGGDSWRLRTRINRRRNPSAQAPKVIAKSHRQEPSPRAIANGHRHGDPSAQAQSRAHERCSRTRAESGLEQARAGNIRMFEWPNVMFYGVLFVFLFYVYIYIFIFFYVYIF